MDWRRHCLPCKHILAIVVHAEGWKSLPLYDRSIRQFSLDLVTAPTEEAETVPAPQELTVGTRSPASDQPTAYTEEPSVGTQSPASDQPNAYTEEPSVGTQSPASYQPNAYTESAQHAASSVQSGTSSLMSLQSKLLQTLRAVLELTYVTDNAQFLQQQLQQQLQHFKRQSSRNKKVMYRIGRRMVRKSIHSSFLRCRLAALRAKRSARRTQRLLKKSQLPGDKLFLTVFTNG